MLKQYQTMARCTVLEEVGGRHGMRKLNPARPKALEVPTFIHERTLALGLHKGAVQGLTGFIFSPAPCIFTSVCGPSAEVTLSSSIG